MPQPEVHEHDWHYEVEMDVYSCLCGAYKNSDRLPLKSFVKMAQPRFSDMSSAQRSASMDNMVRQIEALTATTNAMKRKVHALEEIQAHHGRVVTSYTAFYNRTFWQRLRHLLTGK